ncbi:MAG TPA: hypothetical protein PLR65_04350 [Anaerolineales bacterium]|nr:hypothetical protein [Anaerolineales bacterium]
MKSDSEEQVEDYNKFANQMTVATSTNEFLFTVWGAFFASLFIFGLSFSLILLGLIGVLWLTSLLFDPAYLLFRKIFRLKNLPLHSVKPPTLRAIFIFLMLVIPGFLVFIGIQGLLGGFGPINFGLIHVIIRYFLR